MRMQTMRMMWVPAVLFVALFVGSAPRAAAQIAVGEATPPDDATIFVPWVVGVADTESNEPLAAAPCGEGTVAIVHTAEQDQYVFCVDKTGDVLVIEALADGVETRSRLDQFPDPLDLLMAVAPAGHDVPADVRLSIETGAALHNNTPYVIGQAASSEPIAVNPDEVNAAAACARPSLGFSPTQVFFNDYTYCGMVDVSSTSSNDTDWHQHTASALTDSSGEGIHSHAGPHLPPYEYYYADEDEEGDARYGRARVRSCGGSTLLRGWVKASPTTGSWSPIATYTVQNGHLATMAWYSNSQRSLWMGYDADDIRFRAEAQSGASFGSWFYFLKYAWGPSCNLKY